MHRSMHVQASPGQTIDNTGMPYIIYVGTDALLNSDHSVYAPVNARRRYSVTPSLIG